MTQVEWQLPEGEEPFDRVISIEMLEHMKNYEKLFAKLSTWIKPGGLFFTHIFTHKEYAYHFEAKEDSDWMTKYAPLQYLLSIHSTLFHQWHPLLCRLTPATVAGTFSRAEPCRLRTCCTISRCARRPLLCVS